jgi:hypothetical protein
VASFRGGLPTAAPTRRRASGQETGSEPYGPVPRRSADRRRHAPTCFRSGDRKPTPWACSAEVSRPPPLHANVLPVRRSEANPMGLFRRGLPTAAAARQRASGRETGRQPCGFVPRRSPDRRRYTPTCFRSGDRKRTLWVRFRGRLPTRAAHQAPSGQETGREQREMAAQPAHHLGRSSIARGCALCKASAGRAPGTAPR